MATSAGLVHASIVISEVYPNPYSGESEWVELYNHSDTETVLLENWTLEDVVTTPSTIYNISHIELSPHSYFVATLSASKLNNSGDGVVLKNNLGESIDAMDYTSSTQSKSWSLSTQQTWIETEPSPGESNLEPTPTPSVQPSPSVTATPIPSSLPSPSPTVSTTNGRISLTRYSPCPESSESEWLELENATESVLNATNWRVVDESQNTRVFSAVLQPGVTRITWSGYLLNNTGDSFAIKDESGNTIATSSFSSCTTGDIISTDTTTSDNEEKTSKDDAESTKKEESENTTTAKVTTDNKKAELSEQEGSTNNQVSALPIFSNFPHDPQSHVLSVQHNQSKQQQTAEYSEQTTPGKQRSLSTVILGGVLTAVASGARVIRLLRLE